MEPKYTAQFTIEDLIPESAVETREAHHQFLTDAANAVTTYLRENGTKVTGNITASRYSGARLVHQDIYLTTEGLAVKFECNFPRLFIEIVDRVQVTLISMTIPVAPLERELKDIIHKVYEASQPHPETAQK